MLRMLKRLEIKKEFISVIASGNSVLEIDKSIFSRLKERCFNIGLNYALSYFTDKELDMLMFSDKKVCEWIDLNIKEKPKILYYTRPRAFMKKNIPERIYNQIDYWFDEPIEGFKGNYTLPWLIQAIQIYFPEKTVLLFGLDMYAPNLNEAKFYDKFTPFDFNKRGAKYPVDRKLKQCGDQIKKYVKNKNIFNCNLNSKFDFFPKKNWEEIVK